MEVHEVQTCAAQRHLALFAIVNLKTFNLRSLAFKTVEIQVKAREPIRCLESQTPNRANLGGQI